MMHAVVHYLDLKPLPRISSIVPNQQLSIKPVLEEKNYPTSNVQSIFAKNGKNCNIRLKPLEVAQKSKIELPAEMKFLSQLTPHKNVSNFEKKKLPSKIPVCKKTFHSKGRGIQYDATLSAADKRQKFHESRLRVAPTYGINGSSVIEQNDKVDLHDNFIPCSSAKKINISSSKSILPPIKSAVSPSTGEQNASQAKKKSLLGEITHFPALLNFSSPKCMKGKPVQYVTCLPPISSEPAAPPPSVSSSLEQEANEVKRRNTKKIQEWNACKPMFLHMLIPVQFDNH